MLACDLNAWDSRPTGWTLAPRGRSGPIKDRGNVFMWIGGKSSKEAGAAGGNVLYVDGSVEWKPIDQMNTWVASQGGNWYNSW